MEIEKRNWDVNSQRNTSTEVSEDSVIGAGATVTGELSFPGSVTVFGTISGSLKAADEVVVAKGAKVEATVSASRVSISGEVRGEISGERLEIRSGAKVFGEISAQILVIEEGAEFEGRSSRLKDQSASNIRI